MSKQHLQLYREVWDELDAASHEVSLDEVDEVFKARVVLDMMAAKDAVCKAARHAVDTARTKLHAGQLALPALADPEEHLVTGTSLRVKKAKALDPDMLAALALSDENLANQFAANQSRHAEYRALAPYFHRGLTYNEAVDAYYEDRSSQAAD